eukprot:989726-Pyramimonas_sp.AAC.1
MRSSSSVGLRGRDAPHCCSQLRAALPWTPLNLRRQVGGRGACRGLSRAGAPRGGRTFAEYSAKKFVFTEWPRALLFRLACYKAGACKRDA